MNMTFRRVSTHALAFVLVFSIQAGILAQSTQSPGQSAEVRLPFIELSDFPQLCKKIKQQAKGSLLLVRFLYGDSGDFRELVSLDNRYRDKGLKVVAFSVDVHSNKRRVISLITGSLAKFDVFLLDDSDNEKRNSIIQQEWLSEGFGTVPTTVLFDRQGNRAYLQKGASGNSIKPSPLETAIELALRQSGPGQQPSNEAQVSVKEAQVSVIEPADLSKFISRLKQEAKSGALVLNFWAAWCGPCLTQLNELVVLDDIYRAKGVKIVAVSTDEVAELKSKVIPFLTESKARFDNFLYAYDPDELLNIISKEWPEANSVGSIPTTLILNRQGKCVYLRSQVIDRSELAKAIESALRS